MKGGLINVIPTEKIGLRRDKETIPPQAEELVKFMSFKNSNFIDKNTSVIYGSFMFRIQPYPSDIDSINTVYFNTNEDETIKITEAHIKNIAMTIKNKTKFTWADMKCGKYENGEPIHWTLEETLKGVRTANKQDINGQFSKKNISLYDALSEKGAMLKIDVVVPYMQRYIELSCLYQIKSKEGFITYNLEDTTEDDFLNSLIKDTRKQYNNKKYFKVVKRIFSNAKIRNDIKTLKLLQPLVNSNLSKLSSFKADFSTILLMLSVGKFPEAVVLKSELAKIKFQLNNILDVNIPDELYKMIDDAYSLLINKDMRSVKILEDIEDLLNEIINNETMKYFYSVGISNIADYFGSEYI